jgi:hypothetical protein
LEKLRWSVFPGMGLTRYESLSVAYAFVGYLNRKK